MKSNNKIIIDGLSDFDISQIFDCGQCFRFDPAIEGGIEGVAFGKYIRLEQPDAGSLIIYNSSLEEYKNIWENFLGLDINYNFIKTDILKKFAVFDKYNIIGAAIKKGGGIRILRQDPWEALCSFIISQNNNIPRIKKIIAAMSDTYGEPVYIDGIKSGYHAFPSPEALAAAGIEAIYALKTGFRAKYIYDAACGVANGDINLEAIKSMHTDQAILELIKIKGVGIKVANCALLFGFSKTDAFPVDVWVKRVLEKYYPDGIDISSLGEYAGIAQQYLFYYERYI